MNINLKNCLTNEIPKINLDEIIRYTYGKPYFLWNQDIYYTKYFNLNELIGEEIANILNLKSVHFELFRNTNGEVWLASKNFKNENYKYYQYYDDIIIELTKSRINCLQKYCLNNENYNYLLDNISKLFALDVYMGQNDRCNLNLQLEKDKTGYLDLAPIYDYSDSAWDDNIVYDNFINCFMELEDYTDFFLLHPNSLNLFKKVKSINLLKLIDNIQEKNHFKLPNEIIEIYKYNEENSQRKLEKIIK